MADKFTLNGGPSDTNAKDETLMETKQSLGPFGGHTNDVLKEEKTYFLIRSEFTCDIYKVHRNLVPDRRLSEVLICLTI